MSAYHFFLKHAGYCVKPGETRRQARIRCAKELVVAEKRGQAAGFTFEWVPDFDADLSWLEPGQVVHEVYGCVAYDGTTVVGSLWGICDPDANYRRVIQAELASEALASHYSARWVA